LSTTTVCNSSLIYLLEFSYLLDPNADIHVVLTVCGFMDVGTSTQIINNEGSQSLMDFGELDDVKDACVGNGKAFGKLYGDGRLCVCGNHSAKETSGSLLLGL
jgi:hypothetical protein